MRLVVDQVRGKSANDALDIVRFLPNTAARHINKVLLSAVANAEENFGVSRDDLFIYRIVADEAPTETYRMNFSTHKSLLRFKPILRRNSHVTIILRERE